MKNTLKKDEVWGKDIAPVNVAKDATAGQEMPYDDEITREDIDKMNEIVSDNDFVGYKVVSGPGW